MDRSAHPRGTTVATVRQSSKGDSVSSRKVAAWIERIKIGDEKDGRAGGARVARRTCTGGSSARAGIEAIRVWIRHVACVAGARRLAAARNMTSGALDSVARAKTAGIRPICHASFDVSNQKFRLSRSSSSACWRALLARRASLRRLELQRLAPVSPSSPCPSSRGRREGAGLGRLLASRCRRRRGSGPASSLDRSRSASPPRMSIAGACAARTSRSQCDHCSTR